MRLFFNIPHHKKIFFVSGIVLICSFVFIAAVFATVEERSIYIFPSNVKSEGWQGNNQVLTQDLSGNAIFDDFNPENSVRILYSSDWSVTETPGVDSEVTERPDTETTPEEDATATPEEDGENTQDEVIDDEQETVENPEEQTEEEQEDDQNNTTTSGNRIQSTLGYSTPMPDVGMFEYMGGVSRALLFTKAQAQETDGDGTVQEPAPEETQAPAQAEPAPSEETTEEEVQSSSPENETEEEEVADTTEETQQAQENETSTEEVQDESAQQEDDTNEEAAEESQTVQEEVTEGEESTQQTEETNSEANEKPAETDADTSGGEEEDVSSPEEETDSNQTESQDETNTSGGGGSSSSDEDEETEGTFSDTPILEAPESAEDVTICGVLESECYLLTVDGFGLNWDLDTFDAKAFTLKMSLGAEVDLNAGEGDKLYIRYFDGRKWHIADAISLRGEVSNYTNNGHFSFPLPEIRNWNKLDDLEVQVEYVPGDSRRAEVFVESVWVEAVYEAPETEELPELPQLEKELQALEDSAEPDLLLLDHGEKIKYEHADENEDETLIIKTDKKIYNGLTKATVHFNVTNTSSRSDQFHLQVLFPESRGEVSKLKKYVKNLPVTVEEPIYQPMAQTCQSPWQYDEERNAPEGETTNNTEHVTSEEDPEEDTEDTPVESEEDEQVLGTQHIAQAQEVVETGEDMPVQEETQTEDETTANDDTQSSSETETIPEEEDTEQVSDGSEEVTNSEEAFQETEASEETQADDSEQEQSSEETSQDSETEGVNEETVIETTDSVETSQNENEDTQTNTSNTLGDAIRNAIETESEDEAPAGFYSCADDNTVLYCDSLNADGTNCIQNSVEIGSDKSIAYKDAFVDVGVKKGEQVVEHGLFTRAAQLFGLKPERKEVPKGFVVKDSTAETHQIEPGETLYFEMEISFTAKSRGEFFIEAIGKKGAYGLLDPWWNSGWIYRMPVYVDNTNGGLMTEQQIYLELDSSYTGFWSNVQEDGDDIRFLRQVDGYPEWLDTSFQYRLPITIASTTIDSDLTGFPVYVDLSDLGSDFWNNVQSDGDDIRISASDTTTELPVEVAYFSSGTQSGELYFKADNLSSTADNVFYIYFGSSTASAYADTDTYGTHNVWDSNYKLVTHAHDSTTSSIENSATASNDGTKQSASNPPESTTALFGRSQDFVDDDISHGDLGIGTASSTVEVWIYPEDLRTNSGDQATYGFTVLASAPGGGGVYAPWLTVGGSGGAGDEIRYCAYQNSSTCTMSSAAGLSESTWYYISATAVYGGDTIVKVNDVEEINYVNSGDVGFGNTFTLGDLRPTRGVYYDGIIDEVRVSDIVRSDAWLTTTYENMLSASTFYSAGSAVSYVAPVMEELDFWTQHFSSTSQDARIWVQVDELEAYASTTLYMYYGNAGASSASDQYDPFTYSTTTPLYYQVRDDGGAGDSLLVYSYVNNNTVQFDNGATVTLNRGEATSTTVFYATSSVRSTGPLMAKFDDSGANNYESMVPIGFASTSHSIPPRDNSGHIFHFLSPVTQSTVDLYVGAAGTPSQTNTLATGTAWTVSQDITSGDSGLVEATAPVLVAFEDGGNDGQVSYPTTFRDIYGIFSNNNYIATAGTTDVDVSCSGTASSTMTGFTRGDNVDNTVCTNGASGAGDAVRLYNQTSAIAAVQNADGDGNERSTFWPFMEFSTEYMVPVTTSYIAIACAPETGDVSISLYNTSDTEITSGTCSPGTDNPGQLLFGTDDDNNYTAGFYVKSTDSPAKPFYAYYEDHTDVSDASNGGDENNFTAAVQGRKLAYPELSYTFGAQELSTEPIYTQASYRFYNNTDAEPPTDAWPIGSEDLTEDTEVTASYAVDDGDVLRLRLGVSVSNVAVEAGGNNFTLQYVEAETCDAGGLTWSDVGSIGSGAVWRGYNNASLVDGSTLSTTTLSNADVLGTYEESNDSAFFPNAVAVGEMVEHDWVIEGNGINTNSSYCFRAVTSDGSAFPYYTLYPRVETNSAPEEPSTVSPFDNAKVWDLTPALQFVATDQASDDLNYQVQIDDDYDFSSPLIDANSVSNPTAFSNVTVPSDKAPFTSGNVVQYTVQNNLTNNTTYYWRVRAIDPNGSNQWGEWLSPATSFTTDTAISVSTWFQTTQEQFETDALGGAAYASTNDDVRLGGPIGEYGQVTVTDNGWTQVSTDRTYESMIVVASTRYAGNTVPQRSARVRNKTSNSFEIKVDNYSSSVSGSTVVDYLVVEEETYTIADGGTGRKMVADTELVSGILGNGCATGTPWSATWSFTSAPAVFHTITSNNDPSWVTSNVNDGSNNEPGTTGGEFNLMDGFSSCSHDSSEYIDYIAMDTFHGTTTEGVEYEVLRGIDTFSRSGDTLQPTSFSQTFQSVPQTYINSQITFNGGNGAYSFTDTSSSVTTSTFYGSVDEDGPGADRTGADESASIIAFAQASGTIQALYSGTLTTTEVDFDDAEVGNRWGSVNWSDSETGGTSVLYQVEYQQGGGWELIPDSEIPGNSSGIGTAPIDLTNLDTADYNILRVIATMSSPSEAATPIIQDITISWQQSVYTPTHETPFDNELLGTTTPELTFSTSDPQGDDLTYVVEWSTDSTFTNTSSATSGVSSGFVNKDSGGDSHPFNSGDTIGYTIETPLTEGETYWWRVKATDSGASGWSFYSDPWSFTATSSVSVSTWFQTTKAQFDNDTKSGVEAILPGSVSPSGTVGEYGSLDLQPKTWTEVTLTSSFSNPVVVASARYDSADNTDAHQRRDVRVRNKTSDSFEVKVYDYDEVDETTDFSGTTTVDWIVVEAGDWNIEAGAGGTRVVANTENVSTVLCSTYSGGGQAVTFSPAFTNPPAVFANISSDNDSNWVHAGVDDAVDADDNNEPTTTTAGLFLGRSHANCNHSAEDVDYIAFEKIHSINGVSEFEASSSPDSIVGSPDAAGTAVTYDTAFSATPGVTIVQQMGEDGGQGGYAHVHTGGTNNASTISLALEEDGPSTDRAHTDEVVAYLAFGSSTGLIERVPEAISGTIQSQSIVFSDGTGPKWGELSWTDAEPSTSTSTFQVYYATNSTFALVPDSDLPGNSSGTSAGPIDLGDLDVGTYSTLRILNTLECTAGGTCPSLYDWMVTWSEGITVSGSAYEYDESTPLTSGTVRVALNGVLQPSTGTISGGIWSINNVNAFPNDIVTVWIDGAAESGEAVAITKYDGANDITGMTLMERHLFLGSDDDPILTNTDLGQYDNSVSGNEDIIHEVDAQNDLTTCVSGGCSDSVLFVATSTTYRPDSAGSGNVNTHDIRINGHVLADGNTFRVSGSWDNNGGYTAGTSNVIFTATSSSETIDSTGAATSSFAGITLGEGSGTATWTPVTALDVNRNFVVNYGTYFTNTSSTTIAGNLTVGSGGLWEKGTATTTFDGTGVALFTDNTTPKQDFGKVHVAGTSKFLRTQTDVVITDLTINSGNTFDVTANDYALEIRNDLRNGGTFDAQEGTVTFTATTSGHIINMGPSNLYNVVFDGVGGNWAFPTADVTVDNDLTIINGVVTSPTGIFSIGGSFDVAGGTFVHNNATVRMTSTTAGEVVTPGSNVFYNLVFFGSGGEWSFGQAYATTSNDFEILGGTVVLPSTKLYVIGDFENEAGVFDANNGEVHLHTVGAQRFVESSGSAFNDIRFTGVSIGAGDWYNTSWSHRFSITIPAAQVDANLTDFPVYVDLSHFGDHFWSNVDENGDDIRVTAGDGTTELPYEIASFSTTTRSGQLYFKADSLSSTVDTDFYFYYGNTLASAYGEDDTYGSKAVWSNGYLAVYHFEEDVAGSGNNGVYKDSVADQDGDDFLIANAATGQIGNALDMTAIGITDYVRIPHTVLDGESDVIVSWWMDTNDTGQQAVVSAANAGDNNEFLLFFTDERTFVPYNSNNSISFGISDITRDTWKYFVYEADDIANTSSIWIDGSPDNENPDPHTIGTLSVDSGGLILGQEQDTVGGGFAETQAYDGYLDEVRFATTTRSTGWISTEYNNQWDVASFYSTSTYESVASRTFIDANAAVNGDTVIESGLVTFPSNTFTLNGSLTNSSFFDHNDGTVLFSATSTGHTVDVGGSDFYNVTFNDSAGGWTVTSDATSTNNWSITNANSFTAQSGIRIVVEGTFSNTAPSATTWTGSTLALRSGTGYTVGSKSQNAETYATLELGPNTHVRLWQSDATTYNIDSTASLYSQDHSNVDGNLYIWGAYTRTSGSDYWSTLTDFDGTGIAGAPRTASVYVADTASLSYSNSTLEMKGTSTGTTTVSNQGTGSFALQLTNSTIDAQYYSITNTGTNGLELLGSTTVTSLSNGAFTLETVGGSMITVSSSTIDTNPLLQIQHNTFNENVGSGFNVTTSGVPSSYWWFRNHSGNYDGESFDNDAGNPGDIRWDDSAYTITVTGTVYAGEGAGGAGTVCDGATPVVTLRVDGGTAYTTSCDAGTGAYTLNNVSFSGDVPLIAYLDTAGTAQAATVSRTPTGNISGLDIYENYVIVRHEDLDPVSISHMARYDGTHNSVIPYDASTSTNTVVVDADTALLVWQGKTFVPQGDVTLSSGTGTSYDGTLVLKATSTFTAQGGEFHSIGGDWRSATDATFSASTSIVTFTATTPRSIEAYSNFYDVVLNGAGGSWNVASNLTITDDLLVTNGTLTGASNVTVENGTVTGSGVIAMNGGTFTVETSGNFGGNTDWTFSNLTFGDGTGGSTSKIGTGNITTLDTLTVASGHTLNAGDDTWTLQGGGDVFSVGGTFNADTSTTTYASTTAMNIAPLSYYNLVLAASAAGSPTYTFDAGSPSASTLTLGDGVNTVTANANTNDPLLTVSGDVRILGNATYAASDSNDLLIGGSYTNTGTFTSNAGGVVFNSTDTGETVTSGASSFHHLSFNSATGGWTMLDSATTTGNFSLTDISDFTLTSGEVLEVQGAFTNNVLSTGTTWSGTTLYLNSGTSYTINTKSTGADSYGTLRIGANTDVRMWHSTSSSYSLSNTGSLYSMDHNDVGGDLYIWGDYEQSSAADYWSYATDFDGTDLSGGSERVVDVYLASGATTTLSGGSLEIVGGATATTTIQSQGSGTYSLSVEGGTFEANYYQIRDIDTDGLSMSGSPTVTSLTDGDLLLEQNGGSMITLTASVLDANPVKTWYRIKFATSSGITGGSNVTLVGDSVSSWRFTPALGNYYGEAYDTENGGDPGYIVWDDSNANITVQGNVYSDEVGTVSSVCDGSTPVVRLLVQGASPQSVSCRASDGLYQVNGIVYSPGDTITVYLDTNGGAKAANVTVDPVTSIYNMHLYENRVVVRHEDTNPITSADMSVYDSDDDTDIPFDADTTVLDSLVLPANTKLIVWNNKEFAPNGDVTLNSGSGTSYDGTLELKDGAQLTASSTVAETFSIGGSWLTGVGATFDAGQSTVTFSATTTGKTISPDTSAFYDITFNGSGGSWTFTDQDATSTDDFTINAGTVTLGTSTLAVGGSFVNNASMSAASTSIYFTSNNTETVTFSDSPVASLSFSGSGSWNMTDTNATSSGDVLISGGTVSLPSGTFSVQDSFNNSGGSFIHTTGTLRLYGSQAAQTLSFNNATLHNITIDGSGSWIVADLAATTTGSTTINAGGLTAPASHFGIGGSFENYSTYNSNGGLMYFFATSTGKTINPGGAVLADVYLDGTNGGWTLASHATTTGTWRMLEGSAFTAASSTVLEVQGAFENLIGGIGTNWTDATLFLNASGTSFTINTKSAGGDSYANLIIGDNTDVRMWNSGGSTTTVASSASLYSMDHDSIDGDLYIWGDYERTSGTDYWSYATDFDGAPLGGSSRQVSVRIASTSVISYSAATGLQAVGNNGATTTIRTQDTGTYSLSFGGTSLNMQYYELRDTDSSGFVISGAPTVTSLNYGDFELAIDDGVTLSVSSSTIEQNPTKTISNLWFGTTTGVATGTNVKVDGSTANYWILTSTEGNFDGEAHDDDGVDACGSIRWDDSTCLEVSQAHYRFRADNGGEGAPDNEWYDQDWSHRKLITLDNPNASTLTNYPVRVELAYETEMQSDFGDLRFTDESGTTSLDYYLESTITSATATAWVEVPILAGNDTTGIYVYYGNSFAADAQSGENAFIAFDDFEDNNLTEYSGDTSLFDNNGSHAWQKSYGLSAAAGETQSQTTDGIYRTDQTISQGTTIEFYQKVQNGQDDEPCAYFGVQSGNSGNYAVCLDQFPNDRVVLAENVTSNDASGSLISSSTISYTSGTNWYKVRIDWLTDDSIDVTVYDESGNSLATISDSDPTLSSGGYGFGFWYQAQGWDFFTVRPYAASDPTYTVSTPQQGGGASWLAAQNTQANVESNSNFRIRLSVENSGPEITGQQFRLQYAPKTGYGSCEAVPSVSYNDVPVIASCGVSPICMVASGQFTDQDPTSQLLITGSGLDFTSGYMIEDPSNQSTSMSVATSTLTEVEYAIELTSFATASSYCLRSTNGGVEFDSYARIPEVSVNGVPVITEWTLNEDAPIALTEGQTTAVVATGSVTDVNGFTDLLYATSTFYRSGVGKTCSEDDNNCYRVNSLACPFQNCSGNTCDVVCTADIQFFAEPTDTGSTYEAEDWRAELFVMDFSANADTATSTGVDLLTLWGLSVVTGDIAYGSVELGNDTGSYNATSTLRNTGNDAIDIELQGSDMSSGGSIIPVGNQHYATDTFAYSSCTICSALSGTASTLEVDLEKPASTTPVTDDLYWGIYVPVGVEGTTHYGQNTFYATGD